LEEALLERNFDRQVHSLDRMFAIAADLAII
jgi:hypothetical protein